MAPFACNATMSPDIGAHDVEGGSSFVLSQKPAWIKETMIRLEPGCLRPIDDRSPVLWALGVL